MPTVKAETVFITKPDGTITSLRLPALRPPWLTRQYWPASGVGHPNCDNPDHAQPAFGDNWPPTFKIGRCWRCDQLFLLAWKDAVAAWDHMTPNGKRRLYLRAYRQRPDFKERQRVRMRRNYARRREAATDNT